MSVIRFPGSMDGGAGGREGDEDLAAIAARLSAEIAEDSPHARQVVMIARDAGSGRVICTSNVTELGDVILALEAAKLHILDLALSAGDDAEDA